jgi:hypothetical protein
MTASGARTIRPSVAAPFMIDALDSRAGGVLASRGYHDALAVLPAKQLASPIGLLSVSIRFGQGFIQHCSGLRVRFAGVKRHDLAELPDHAIGSIGYANKS